MATAEPVGGAADLVTYETLDEGRIARIWLNRPDAHNAQNRTLLVQLDEAFGRAEADDEVRVVILAARGKNFSAGHDLGSEAALAERTPGPAQHPTFRSYGATRASIAERTYLQEWHFYFENTRRWRDLRKITIASVQGNVISAGLMLMWACDLIVAADTAKFSDVVGVRMGMPGVEYYAHPWEFGPRKAKELLLTGDSIDAEEAYRLTRTGYEGGKLALLEVINARRALAESNNQLLNARIGRLSAEAALARLQGRIPFGDRP